MMLMRGRDKYGEGRIFMLTFNCLFRMPSSQFLCHEWATIKGVQLFRKATIYEIIQAFPHVSKATLKQNEVENWK